MGFSLFLIFVQKTIKMAAMTIHRKRSNFLTINISVMQNMICITYLNSSHFSNQLRHFICQILISGFKDMNSSILNVKRKK